MRFWHYSLLFACIAVPFAGAGGQAHGFSVSDDIEMSRFNDPYPLPGLASSDVVRRSPNGRYFVTVTTKGILDSNLVESAVTIFESPNPTPRAGSGQWKHWTIATLRSYPHHEQVYAYPTVIKDVRWSPNSLHVFFRGEEQDGTFRVYEAATNGGGCHPITPQAQSVVQYDIASGVLVYRAITLGGTGTDRQDPVKFDSRDVTGESLEGILFARQLAYLWPEASTLWTKKLDLESRTRKIQGPPLLDRIPSTSMWTPFAASPTGDKLIELEPVKSVPQSWESYKAARGFEERQFRISDTRLTRDDNPLRPRRYVLVDLHTGSHLPLIDGPAGYALTYSQAQRVVWSQDGQSVLVTNVFLPLDHTSKESYEQRLRPCAAARVEIRDLQVSCLIFDVDAPGAVMGGIHLEDVDFGENNDEVVLSGDIASKTHVVQSYHYVAGSWKLLRTEQRDNCDGAPPHSGQECNKDVYLVVRQTLNDPPALWATNGGTGKSVQVWDPNPQFAHILFGNVSVYHWTDRTGYEWTGGLVKPVGYAPGQRYPLVIQLYNFYGDQFLTDGTDPTAFAARELASAGFVVLQIQRKPLHTLDDAEVQGHFEGYRSAIEQLDVAGLIDPRKVGVVGFSWTCWYVEHALIKAPDMFAAATIADGVDHSYISYHLFDISEPALQQQDEKIIGAKPFGDGLKRWLDSSPGFHLDQVQTPLRIEAITPLSLLEEWELYSSLKMQNKPVDLIYFPSGTHVHQKPRERFESQQGDVDWFRFWLQGYEDPDSAKRDQYTRWRRLRNGSKQLGSMISRSGRESR